MAGETAKRKLTTILAADVVSYSQLMARDEEGTLSRLKAYRAVSDRLVDKHNGRVFNTAGDAFLAEFDSAVEAVRCAISIQEDLAVRNAQLSEDQQMWLRIGINVGDVMVEDGDLFGDGVNVAARLEGLAEPGGICISGSTFDQVKNKLSIAFDDIGAQRVKNIPEPVPAFRIVPGRVAVKETVKAASVAKTNGLQKLMMLGAAVAVIGLGGAYLGGLLSPDIKSAHPFDGRWQVSVDALTGCRDNAPRTFVVSAKAGTIDEPNHLFPKSGQISSSGEFNMTASDQDGKLLSHQTAKIRGDTGQGTFTGRLPGCQGQITLQRIE